MIISSNFLMIQDCMKRLIISLVLTIVTLTYTYGWDTWDYDSHALSERKRMSFEYTGPDGQRLRFMTYKSDKDKNSDWYDWVELIGWDEHYLKHRDYYKGAEKVKPYYDSESIVIPETVEYKGKTYVVRGIGEYAFANSHVKSIDIPKTLKFIRERAFDHFNRSFNGGIRVDFNIHDIAGWCEVRNKCNFNYRGNLYLNGRIVTDLVIPNTVKRIEDRAFGYFQSIRTVTIPGSVETIGYFAFDGCKKLSSLNLSEGLVYISLQAFKHTNISKLRIPSSVKKISWDAFSWCNNLVEVLIDNPKIEIGKETFYWCKSLRTVRGLSSMSKIDDTAFDKSGLSLAKVKQSFSYYLASNIYDKIDDRQKKGEFESTEQWRNRVNTANRDKKVRELTEELRKGYIARYKKTEPVPTILGYGADNGIFSIKTGDETLYVRVPLQEAQQFKANFKPEYIQSEYGIVDDYVSLIGRTCKVGNKVYASTNTYAKADNLDALAINLPPLEMNFGEVTTTTAPAGEQVVTDRTIDLNIPATGVTNNNTFAIIIGNEDYEHVGKVQFAKNDARVFAEYCRKTLGLPAKNVRGYENATYGKILSAVQDIQSIANAYKGNINVIFYYAGHGVPNGSQAEAYLLPVDADGRQMSICYPLSKLYQELGNMNVKSVTVLLDACFSGSQRGDGMLTAARSVALKAKADAPRGNMVVITAANGEQTAYPYKEKGHGMFTYYLLKKLRDTKGNCTLGELGKYICDEVAKQAIVTNGREQTPVILASPTIATSWRMMKLR